MIFHTLSLCLQTYKQQKLHLSAKQLLLFTLNIAFLTSLDCAPFFTFVLVLSISVLLAEMFLADKLLIAAVTVVIGVAGHNFELMSCVLWVVEALLAEARIADFAVEASIV